MAVLQTARLRLRPFVLGDASDVQRLAGEYDVAANTLRTPHPYPPGFAETWILGHRSAFEREEEVRLAMVQLEDGALVGAIGLMLNPPDRNAELGYWLGKPFWGLGYATEAGRAMLDYGFTALGLERIHAAHFARNPASGRVLLKLGMRHEGLLRRHVLKWGVLEDVDKYGILREEWLAGAAEAAIGG